MAKAPFWMERRMFSALDFAFSQNRKDSKFRTCSRFNINTQKINKENTSHLKQKIYFRRVLFMIVDHKDYTEIKSTGSANFNTIYGFNSAQRRVVVLMVFNLSLEIPKTKDMTSTGGQNKRVRLTIYCSRPAAQRI